jgi:hypothetical protein
MLRLGSCGFVDDLGICKRQPARAVITAREGRAQTLDPTRGQTQLGPRVTSGWWGLTPSISPSPASRPPGLPALSLACVRPRSAPSAKRVSRPGWTGHRSGMCSPPPPSASLPTPISGGGRACLRASAYVRIAARRPVSAPYPRSARRAPRSRKQAFAPVEAWEARVACTPAARVRPPPERFRSGGNSLGTAG